MEFENRNISETILHLACESGNIELVKYIISLNKIDITSKNIFIYCLLGNSIILSKTGKFNNFGKNFENKKINKN